METKKIEIEAKNVKEAIKIARQGLGVSRDKVEIKVLREENKGCSAWKAPDSPGCGVRPEATL